MPTILLGTRLASDDVVRARSIPMLVWLALTACGSSSTSDGAQATANASATTDAPADTIDVPLHNFERNSGGGRGLSLDVVLGGASAKPLIVDTGSTGIHVLADDVSAGQFHRTGKKIVEAYFDGTSLVGEEALAIVKIGEAATATPIAVHLVDEVRCSELKPRCGNGGTPEDPKGLRFFHDAGVSGIVGIGMSNAFSEPEVFSPLAQLPGNLSSGYVIQTSGYAGATAKLTIGVTDAIRHTFKTQHLQPQSHKLPNGIGAWEDARVQVCYSLDGTTLQNECAASIFDTGATAFFWNTTKLYTNEVDAAGTLKAGKTVVAKFADIDEEWRITTTERPVPGVDMVISSPGVRNTNLGIGVYFAYDVLSDVKNGAIGVRKPALPR